MENENAETIELFNRSFKIVKRGLDESEVTAFVKEVMSERDQLLKRQENLTMLTRLYEKTVIEAGELAKQIEKEAREKVQKEANTILTQAHERAKVMTEQQKTEAAALVQQQLNSVKGHLKQQLDTLFKEEIARAQSTIKEAAKQVSDTMLSQADNLIKMGRDFEINLDSEMFKTVPAATMAKTTVNVKGSASIKTDTAAAGLPGKNEKDIVEVEIKLPRDQDEIANIKHALDIKPEINHVELQTMVDKSVLNVVLTKPVDLLEFLRGLPEVYQADSAPGNGHKKIIVTLAAKAQLDAQNNELRNTIMNALVNKKA
jgi:cell division septum initiation protein DivIVA